MHARTKSLATTRVHVCCLSNSSAELVHLRAYVCFPPLVRENFRKAFLSRKPPKYVAREISGFSLLQRAGTFPSGD